MKFIVQWEELHVYGYSTIVEADSPAAAKRMVNSHDVDNDRDGEYIRVKSVGRKKAESYEETPRQSQRAPSR